MKFIVIGGVAAGASAAARLRRLDEQAQIILLERGNYISYANCGLPYHLGGVIEERNRLVVMPEQKFKAWFHIEVRTGSEAVALDRKNKTVTIRTAEKEYTESYDRLLIATGASPVPLALPGADDPRIFRLWTIPDMDGILAQMEKGAKKALVLGGGFVGLEAAENLNARGMETTLVQHSSRLMPNLDPEMSAYLVQELKANGIDVRFQEEIRAFEKNGNSLTALFESGTRIDTDLVILSIGVKPNSKIAADAGLKTGKRGHIIVNEHLQTDDPDIFAAGDVIEVIDPVTGHPTAVPLAGPANKQGRIAADNLHGGTSSYRGTLGAMIIKVGDLTAAAVGLTEKRIRDLGIPFRKIYTHPASSAGYYPASTQMHMKLMFGTDGKILGAQIVGSKGVDKRIDTIAGAMKAGYSADDLANLEFSYAPPFNSAKDPVNFLGMIAQNVRNGLADAVAPDEIPADAVILDVREESENELGSIPGSRNIPLGQLRDRLGELDKTKKILTLCQVGLRGYLAERILRGNGFQAGHISGGYLTWRQFQKQDYPLIRPEKHEEPVLSASGPETELNVRGLACPGPVVRLKKQISEMPDRALLRLLAPTSFAPDLTAWASASGNKIESLERKPDCLEAVIRKQPRETNGEKVIPAEKSAALVLFSNDLDKAMAAFIIACGMAASGMKVGIFFTFWGLSVLRKNPAPEVKKDLVSRMFGWMLPKGPEKLILSKMNMMGMGSNMMKEVMKRKNVTSLPELIQQARGLGVRFVACEMAMDVMGISREELMEVDEVAGVASFAAMAEKANSTLFI